METNVKIAAKPTVKLAVKPAAKTNPTPAANPAERDSLRYLNLGLIADHSEVAYRTINAEHVAFLEESIKAQGLITPLVVWDGGADYPTMELGGKTYPSTFLEAGRQRRAALRAISKKDPARFKELFPKGIPVVVTTGTLKDYTIRQLAENLARSNPTLEEVYPHVMSLLNEHHMKKGEIAAQVGVSPSYITQVVAIKETLGEAGEQALLSGNVTARKALKAVQAVKAGIKSGKPVDVAKEVAKAKEQTTALAATGAQRAPKRTSLAKLWAAAKVLPSMTLGARLTILEGIILYALGEKETLPKEIKAALKTPSSGTDS